MMEGMSDDERALETVLEAIEPLDRTAMAAAAAHLDGLTKPPGSLGRLESLLIELAGITGRADPPVAHRAIVVAAADHGVVRQGVSAYPSEVTAQMVANFMAGGAAVNSSRRGQAPASSSSMRGWLRPCQTVPWAPSMAGDWSGPGSATAQAT